MKCRLSRRDPNSSTFTQQARLVLDLPIAHRVNPCGGYGPGGEVIYDRHPAGCPSVLVDQHGGAKATFMTNGSIAFEVHGPDGKDVRVLAESFNAVDKRECDVPSQNVWLRLSGKVGRLASLINPGVNVGLAPQWIKIVKLGDPCRGMWYCAGFSPGRGARFRTAVKFALVRTRKGPALLREVYIENLGNVALDAALWTYFRTSGTQYFVYNRDNWYDLGLPVSETESVVSASVPYRDELQIKRVSSAAHSLRPTHATCDYQTFAGDSAATILLPHAVIEDAMRPGGAGRKLNRFSTASVAANRFAVKLAAAKSAWLAQSLLYVTDPALIGKFRAASASESSAYAAAAARFRFATRKLIAATPDASAERASSLSGLRPAEKSPFFAIEIPRQKALSEYANSVWTGVRELYENCRAHGKMLADGIEIGTRDRGQDMWPMMKEDPGRVRADLVHAFGLIYVTCDKTPVVKPGRRLTLVEKLHGMFPRQYPSRWVDRSREVDNDNRPYADSPLWLLDSACRYLRETGDTTILSERVKSVTLTNPQDPVHSAMIGCDREFLFAEVMLEILESFQRMAQDSPYGLAQIMYGDWCDPVDMFGTFPVGDAASRGKGRGVQVRLSAHAFLCAVEVLDALSAPNLRAFVARNRLQDRLAGLKRFAHELRRNVVKWGWEDSRKRGFHAGFLSCIHELRRDGSVPDYAAGETGYTLGSMQRRDFDRENRRELCANAFGLAMLLTQRDYLTPIADSPDMVGKIVQMAKELFYDPKLGLLLFTRPIPNTPDALRLVGRMGMIPAGTAENGEYHHGQMFMHRFMQELPAEVEACYRHFLPMLSAMRDETLGGPFDTPSTSYASDRQDPHFGKGMYFGLSGSTDWIVDYFEALAGLRLNLADASRPDVVVAPRLPRAFQGAMTYRRILHVWNGKDGYRRVPLEIAIRHARGGKASAAEIRINGKRTERAVVESLHGVKRLKIDFALAEGARFDGQ